MESIPHASGIYQILCVPTGKVYIGSTKRLSKRWQEHRRLLRQRRHFNRHLQASWNKYGENAFTFSVLQECEPSELIDFEQFWLDATSCYDSRRGFNARPVADRNTGITLSAERRAEISVTSRAMWTPALRALMSEKHKGRPQSSEHKANKAASLRGKKRTGTAQENIVSANKGRTWTAEARAKMSVRYARTWVVTDPDANEMIIVNLHSFCREHGLDVSHMSAVALGKARQHKGWTCRAVSETESLKRTTDQETNE